MASTASALSSSRGFTARPTFSFFFSILFQLLHLPWRDKGSTFRFCCSSIKRVISRASHHGQRFSSFLFACAHFFLVAHFICGLIAAVAGFRHASFLLFALVAAPFLLSMKIIISSIGRTQVSLFCSSFHFCFLLSCPKVCFFFYVSNIWPRCILGTRGHLSCWFLPLVDLHLPHAWLFIILMRA